LVSVLTPLRASADGVHQVTLALEPEGLGSVRATVTVGNDHIAVQLTTDNPDGHEALRQSLPQLRQLLQGENATGATVTLSDGRGHSSAGENRNRTSPTSAPSNGGEDDSNVGDALVTSPDGDGHLVDVRL
jgi:flagellar hook-length control protein FliK